MSFFDTFPWVDDPALILIIISIGILLRVGARLADDVLDNLKCLFERFKKDR